MNPVGGARVNSLPAAVMYRWILLYIAPDDVVSSIRQPANRMTVELTNSRQWHSTYSAKAFQW
jgi:hypothetical protein